MNNWWWLAAACGLVGGLVMRWLHVVASAWWRRRQARTLPSGEVCRTCLEEPTVADCWATVEHYANLPEMGNVGGTLGRAFWCTEHKPDDAVPFRP